MTDADLSSEQRNEIRQRLRQKLRSTRSGYAASRLLDAEHSLAENVAHWIQQLSISPDKALATPPCEDQSTRVGGYRAVHGEISLGSSFKWLRNNHCSTFLPVVTGQSLLFVPCDENTQFTQGKYGIDIPLYEPEHAIEADQLDIVLAPLLGFDIQGNRLGMGGGYYDRTFAYRMEPLSTRQQHFIGVAHEFQRTDTLPFEKWDVPLDAVITDKNIYRCEKNRKSSR